MIYGYPICTRPRVWQVPHTGGLGYIFDDQRFSGIVSMIHQGVPGQGHISKLAMLNSFYNIQANGIAPGYQASINLESNMGKVWPRTGQQKVLRVGT